MAAKTNLASSKDFDLSMNARTHVLRPPTYRRDPADPFAAILPEVAEPKLDTTLADEEDCYVPLRQAVRVDAEIPLWRRLFGSKSKR